MSRVEQIKAEDWPDEMKELLHPERMTDLEQGLMRYWAHRPDLVQGLAAFSGGLKMNRTLSEKLVELVRLRIAFFNQCRSCMAIRYTDAVNDGLTEDLVCSLERPEESPDLTDAEKVAIKFGELMAADHLSIDDSIYAELRAHYSQEEIVELGMTAAFFVGFGRLAATYHMVEELPHAFQGTDAVSPWHNDAIVVR
ncbi:MAG: carboxymuconolactone decarboxylase family protein [Pseudomonadales bacterium]|jgi:AhpD family alkylhydroperoxidase|nr:carboxymuconolactone decarboxylase family protein [Pseudomonadales bacterium]